MTEGWKILQVEMLQVWDPYQWGAVAKNQCHAAAGAVLMQDHILYSAISFVYTEKLTWLY